MKKNTYDLKKGKRILSFGQLELLQVLGISHIFWDDILIPLGNSVSFAGVAFDKEKIYEAI